MVVGNVLRSLFRCGERGVVDDYHVLVRQVIEQGDKLLLEQRQPVFHARQPPSVAYRFVKRVLRCRRAEFLAIAAAEAFDAVFVEQRLARREQQMTVEPPGRHLRVWIETAERFQLVSEEIEPKRLFHSAWEDVHDAAPDGVFALVDHRVGAAVALSLQ